MPVFEFVDHGDPTGRTRAMSHVVRKAHRDRRLREVEAYQSGLRLAPKALQFADRAATSILANPKLNQPIGQQHKQALLPPQYTKLESTLKPPATEADSDKDVPAIECSDEQNVLDTYTSRVAANPHDSFWTVYSQLNAEDRNLLQWFLVAVPELSFGTSHTAPINPMRDWIFPLVEDSSVVLNSSLLVSAVNNPSFFRGEEGASRVSIRMGRTISLINQALQKGQPNLGDDILYAVSATALSEDRLGNPVSCRTHLNGLQHMIRLRGGIRSLRKNAALCAGMAWAEISVSNYAGPVARSQNSNETSRIATLAMLEARHEEEIFCEFLSKLQRVQLSRRHSHDSIDNQSWAQTEFLFQKGSPLLAMLGDSDRDSGVITPVSRMNVKNCQIACLFYINFMLCEFHNLPQSTAAFLLRLSTLVATHTQGKIPRASLFVWVFVREIERDDEGIGKVDRLEWLIRMIRVARRLTPESSQRLHQALIESLRSHEGLDTGIRVSNDLGIVASRVEMGLF